ncbi:MAG: hypothetical protein AB1Z81_05115 [Desulfotignum sp.]
MTERRSHPVPGLLTGFTCLCISLFLFLTSAGAYPVDGYDTTGIRRLKRLAPALSGQAGIPSDLPPGARLAAEQITLHLTSTPLDLSDTGALIDSGLQRQIQALFPNRDESYSLVVLDISPDRPVRMAWQQADRRFPVGSVGKLAVAAGLFAQVQQLFPDDVEKRRHLLKTRMVTAGPWIISDHHNIPVFVPETGEYSSRPARTEDRFSLYEWADHMISASANAAASVLWKELVLMRHFGSSYPPDRETEDGFFAAISKTALSDLAEAVVNEPLSRAGLSRQDFHLGSLFTSEGKKRIPGTGDSRATPLGLLKYLVALEQGRLVDPWSSLEIKRLMYTTARRIRYASSPALGGAAVYFKSGSLYRCMPEPGFTCRKYMGNQENVMNSVAIVEHTDSRIYLVALMTNVLKKNSAVDHQTLATQIDTILRTLP